MQLRSVLTAVAIMSAAVAISPQAAAMETLADLGTASDWTIQTTGGIKSDNGPAQTLRLEFSTDSSPRKSVTLMARKPAVLPDSTVRMGMWLFVRQPVALSGGCMIVQDRAGETFEYTLPALNTWQTGWQYLDTYPFDANELGRLHPQVGRMVSGGAGLPQRPLKCVGLRLEAKGDAHGELLLGRLQADSYTLGTGQWHWALTVPGQHSWTDTTLIRSDESPYMLAGQVMPDGGDADVTWSVRAGFQGPEVQHGSQHMAFDAQDAVAKGVRIPLGDLPAGNYEVQISRRLRDLRSVTPTSWNRLVWHAEGEAVWDDVQPSAGKRCISARKQSGEGYAGWRQTPAVAGPGNYRFSVSARCTAGAEARITPLDRERRSVGHTTVMHFASSTEWVTRESQVDLPAETDRVYIDLVTTQNGEASFDAVTLQKDGQEFIVNGSAEQGQVLTQMTFPLVVVASKASGDNPPAQSWSVDPGETLAIPSPAWARESGDKTWLIQDEAGATLASGAISDEPVQWSAQKPGIYHYVATRKSGALELDRQTLLLGCRTPKKQLGEPSFHHRSQAPTEEDLFGPGRNYFTWSMYEYHPDQPGFFKECQQWVRDGRAAGFKLFRIRIDWNFAEPLPGVFDFAMTDQLVAEVIRQGGQVVLEPSCRTPAWLDTVQQISDYGRADVWKRGVVGRMPSIWSPAMLDHIKQFTQAVVLRYRNNPEIVGYHLWGLPGSVDWTTVDQPWLGQRMDYSLAAAKAFFEFTTHRYTQLPKAGQDWSKPDLSDGWRDWVAFRTYSLEHFFLDSALKPLRELDDRRPVVGYFGLDFASQKMTESTRTLHWRRHTGGCELYYQIPLQAARAVFETGRDWPQEVHYMTPLAPALEQATFQISTTGGQGFNWNYYWRTNISVGQWTPDREAGLVEWQKTWRPLWQELRDATLAQQPDVAGISTWSTMEYGVRSFFPLRLGDYATRTAAAMYRDQLWPTWFSENAPLDHLDQLKLIVVPSGAAQVMPARLADALANYVKNGGHLVMFPDSGKWVIEEGSQPDALLRRLDWKQRLTAKDSSLQTVDLGNSGLPSLPGSDRVRSARAVEGSLALPVGAILNLQHAVKIPEGDYQTHATFEDGTPAVVGWTFGRGQVLLITGNPDWMKAPRVMSALYHWAGGHRDVGTNLPYMEINHLRHGQTHYLILHRLPDSLSPHLPMPYADLDRQKLHTMAPEAIATWHLSDLPSGQWKVEDATAAIVPAASGYPGVYPADVLAKGLPIPMLLAQTRVLKITRADGQ